MAFQNSQRSQPDAAQKSVALDRDQSILRASRLKTARWRGQWGNGGLIKANKLDATARSQAWAARVGRGYQFTGLLRRFLFGVGLLRERFCRGQSHGRILGSKSTRWARSTNARAILLSEIRRLRALARTGRARALGRRGLPQ